MGVTCRRYICFSSFDSHTCHYIFYFIIFSGIVGATLFSFLRKPPNGTTLITYNIFYFCFLLHISLLPKLTGTSTGRYIKFVYILFFWFLYIMFIFVLLLLSLSLCMIWISFIFLGDMNIIHVLYFCFIDQILSFCCLVILYYSC